MTDDTKYLGLTTLAIERLKRLEAANLKPGPEIPPRPTEAEYLQARMPYLGKIEVIIDPVKLGAQDATPSERYRALKEANLFIAAPDAFMPRGAITEPGRLVYGWSSSRDDEPEKVFNVELIWEGATFDPSVFTPSPAATAWYQALHPDQDAVVSYSSTHGFPVPESVATLALWLLYVGRQHEQLWDPHQRDLGTETMDWLWDSPYKEKPRNGANWYHDQVRSLGIQEMRLTKKG